MRTVLLFDVDGVLIHPRGYKEALRATLDRIAKMMGQPPVAITDDEMNVFESLHLTNEWDSAAMVAAALLIDVLNAQPDLCHETLDGTLQAIREAGVRVPRRDLSALARECMGAHSHGMLPSQTIHAILRPYVHVSAYPLLDEVLRDIYSWRSPTTYILQHYTLGSKAFVETYGEPPQFETDSYLAQYDKPNITPETSSRLLDRLTDPDWYAAIFTARSSRWPADYVNGHDGSNHLYPPEGDLVMELLGFSGHIPMIASGRLAWLSTRRGRGIADYVKPSPVHALSAIGAAVSGRESAALEAAADLVEHNKLTGPLAMVADGKTRVVVFEDSSGGIRSTRGAVEKLQQAGVDVCSEAVGVSPHPAKQETLNKIADRVVNDINEALIAYL
jgi:hypothetical protein